MYSRARFALEFRRFVAREGAMVLPAPLDHIAVPSDTFGAWVLAQMPQAASKVPPLEPWAGQVHSWQLIGSKERLKHQALFSNANMAYVGNDYLTPIDTTVTPRIRSRMQSAFGAPTKTVVESAVAGQHGESMQFEYWFIVNDSIPVIVMDANGPHDHGVVLASDHQYREQLYVLRQSLLGRVVREAPYEPFVDYFFDQVVDRWYRTGYDGEAFFAEPIPRPDLAHGRPKLPPEEP